LVEEREEEQVGAEGKGNFKPLHDFAQMFEIQIRN
jgi:hypothetical protein